MVVALPFNASLSSLQLPRVLQRSTVLAARGRRLSHPSRTTTSTELTSRTTMSSRRSARLSARLQAEPTRQDAPTAVKPAASPPATKTRKRKVPTSEVKVPAEAPATPKRRAKNAAVPSLPSDPTATPSAVRLIAEPAATTVSTPKPKPRAVERLADPNLTNALLLSPETSRVISYNPISTANILEEACAHLIKGKTFPIVTVCRWCVLGLPLGSLLYRSHTRPQDLFPVGRGVGRKGGGVKPIHYRAIMMQPDAHSND